MMLCTNTCARPMAKVLHSFPHLTLTTLWEASLSSITFLFSEFPVEFKGRNLGFFRQSMAIAVSLMWLCCNYAWAATLAYSQQWLLVSAACSSPVTARTTHCMGHVNKTRFIQNIILSLCFDMVYPLCLW